MSTTEPENGNRATAALVLTEVRGLRDLTDAKFTDVQRQLNKVESLPVAVQSLSERVLHSEARLTELEKRDDERQGWRKVTLPQISIGVVALVIGIGQLYAMFHGT